MSVTIVLYEYLNYINFPIKQCFTNLVK